MRKFDVPGVDGPGMLEARITRGVLGLMGAGLSVDLAALERVWHALRRVAGHLRDLRVSSAFGDVPGALPTTDTAAACADLARRLDTGVLAFADELATTSDAVAAAAVAYCVTDELLAAATGGAA